MNRGVNVEISPNVIVSIASKSALEVKGVYSLETSTNVSFWKRPQPHGVRVNILDNNKVRLEVYVIAEEGYYLPEVGLNLQEHIKEEIENAPQNLPFRRREFLRHPELLEDKDK